ncbi:diacylglycerol/lipid kinase family protein [Niabella ginsengisoli]|uniref:Diacylglycerol kinase family lipid kinase n=1 Tax=Niabella ginsengisoli TaxID=522298 RepID=A0ABS9SE26_9BACT|nr:diacylglycerol kinase family protein [Niabella ginsengisoli]MCH5596611.1 diacylglycerol kinase family lipid kinase [Niabella ginsengisoli]
MSVKILFIINNIAGNKTIDWQSEIKTYFNGKNVELDFYDLTDPVDCGALDNYIKSAKANKVVAVGGDGTIALVAESVQGTGMALGIIPAGSANGMAKELLIPVKLPDALNIIENGVVTGVDTILLNNEHMCLHLSDAGINAQLIKNFEEGDTRGKIGYLKVAWKTLVRRQSLNIKIEHNNSVINRKAFMIVIANAGKYGTGAVINPVGEINDGIFEVVVVKRLSFFGILKMMFSLGFDKKISKYTKQNLLISFQKAGYIFRLTENISVK